MIKSKISFFHFTKDYSYVHEDFMNKVQSNQIMISFTYKYVCEIGWTDQKIIVLLRNSLKAGPV